MTYSIKFKPDSTTCRGSSVTKTYEDWSNTVYVPSDSFIESINGNIKDNYLIIAENEED